MFWNKKKIYLDHAAATPVSTAVMNAMKPYWSDYFYNPGGLYAGAVKVRSAIESSRASIADAIGCQSQHIIFTAGGTESNNLALQGVLYKWRYHNPGKKPHIVISNIEHAAVRELCLYLKNTGVAELTIVPVNTEGILSPDDVKSALRDNTVIVSVGYANSEIGVVQPITLIAKAIRHFKKTHHGDRNAAYPLLHSDAIAAANYIDVRPQKLGIDLVSLSAAKMYGPKGVACLYVKDLDVLDPVIVGGGQEGGLRSGTENVPLVVGFATAFVEVVRSRDTEYVRLVELQKYFFEQLDILNTELQKEFDFLEKPIRINGSREHRLPNNINISFEKLSSEQIVIELDAQGVMVSSRAACSENDDGVSHVLQALMQDTNTATGGIRITLGKHTTHKDIVTACAKIRRVIQKLYTTYQTFNATL